MKLQKHIAGRIKHAAFGTRPIRTDFFATQTRRKLLRVNRARYAFNAVPNAITHMQINEYDAQLCEVYDERTGKLFAQIKRGVNGALHIAYMCTPKRGE